ncbi:hypothetical protein Bhz60_00021 [Stenotrophomonas phage vB_SmaS_Bhz60]
MSDNNGFIQGLPKKSGYYLFRHKQGGHGYDIMVKVLLPEGNSRKLVRFMEGWVRGGRPKPDVQATDHEFCLDDPFVVNGWYRAVNIDADTEVRVAPNPAVAAIAYALELADQEDDGDAVYFLRMWNEGQFEEIRAGFKDVPDGVFIGAESGYEPVTLVQDGGGA